MSGGRAQPQNGSARGLVNVRVMAFVQPTGS
jgi:hypothetical protein